MRAFFLTAAAVTLFLVISSCSGGGDGPARESQRPTEPEVVEITEEAPQPEETTKTDSTATLRATSSPTSQREEPREEPEPTSGQTSDQTEPATPLATSEPEPTLEPTPSRMPEPTPEATSPSVSTWRGLVIAAENRCSPYDPANYRYSPSVEPDIVAGMGGIIYGPYSQLYFDSIRETDIEHIVARSEAHDSGLCSAEDATRKAFAEDLLNLTLASPSVNRHQKSDNDAAEWLPDHNRCWFADRVLQVRQKYGLTIDQAEADALETVLSGCSSVELVVAAGSPIPPTPVPQATTPTPTPPTSTPQATASPAPPEAEVDALAMWDSNNDGKITCAEAREHGIAPVREGHPAYPYMNDADGDGIVCE